MQLLSQYLNYIKDNPNKYWFRAKLYGWGWTPATWQGWLTTLLYLVLIFFIANNIKDDATPNEVFYMLVVPMLLLTLIFIWIAYKKGEQPRWSWGKPKEK